MQEKIGKMSPTPIIDNGHEGQHKKAGSETSFGCVLGGLTVETPSSM
jgi:hypothetical protein